MGQETQAAAGVKRSPSPASGQEASPPPAKRPHTDEEGNQQAAAPIKGESPAASPPAQGPPPGPGYGYYYGAGPYHAPAQWVWSADPAARAQADSQAWPATAAGREGEAVQGSPSRPRIWRPVDDLDDRRPTPSHYTAPAPPPHWQPPWPARAVPPPAPGQAPWPHGYAPAHPFAEHKPVAAYAPPPGGYYYPPPPAPHYYPPPPETAQSPGPPSAAPPASAALHFNAPPTPGPRTDGARSDGGGAGQYVGRFAAEQKRCAWCNTDSTPQWRKGPSGVPGSLCNACGLKFDYERTKDRKNARRRALYGKQKAKRQGDPSSEDDKPAPTQEGVCT